MCAHANALNQAKDPEEIRICEHCHTHCDIIEFQSTISGLSGPVSLVFGDAISNRLPMWLHVNGASNGVVVHCGNLRSFK